MDAAPEHFNNPNYTYPPFLNVSKNYDNISQGISSHNSSDNGRGESFNSKLVVISITALVISVFGAVGNGMVIWLLGFRIKRNPFSIYILNLAVADLGVLLSAPFVISVICLSVHGLINSDTILICYIVFFLLFLLTYSAGQFLLTAISFDRCVAVFFPLWHQCKRPPRLSTIVCTLIWLLSVLFAATNVTLIYHKKYEIIIVVFSQLIVNTVLCLPVMTIATVALFIKVCLKTRQHRRRKLLTIILLSLLFFLLFAFPYNLIYILFCVLHGDLLSYMQFTAMLLACLNSSVNPFIYFLVGRQGKSRRQKSMKMILQKVFQEEEGCTEETPAESQS